MECVSYAKGDGLTGSADEGSVVPGSILHDQAVGKTKCAQNKDEAEYEAACFSHIDLLNRRFDAVQASNAFHSGPALIPEERDENRPR